MLAGVGVKSMVAKDDDIEGSSQGKRAPVELTPPSGNKMWGSPHLELIAIKRVLRFSYHNLLLQDMGSPVLYISCVYIFVSLRIIEY